MHVLLQMLQQYQFDQTGHDLTVVLLVDLYVGYLTIANLQEEHQACEYRIY